MNVARARAIVSAGRCAPGGVADIVAAEPLEHERGGVPSAVLAGHEADACLDRAVAGEQLRVSAAAAAFVVVVVVVIVVRTASRVGRERERGRAREVSHPPPPSRVSSPPGEPPDPSRDEPPLVSEESARRIARHREGASPLAVRRHARRVEEWARADGEMTGRSAFGGVRKKPQLAAGGSEELVADWFHFVTREVGPLAVSLSLARRAQRQTRRPDAP